MRPARLVTLALAALAFAPVAVPPATAAAEGAIAFTATAHINCFGCGFGSGTANLWSVGATTGSGAMAAVQGMTAPNGSANYNVNEPTGASCVVSGTAYGSVTGAVNVAFAWTRVGELALITTTGDIDGVGFAVFHVTSPTGIPCGGPVDAQIAGFVVSNPDVNPTAPTECSDGLDNDLDGRTDYPSDPGCSSPSDTSEASDASTCSTVGPVCIQAVAGPVVQTVAVQGTAAGTAHHVTGKVDVYSFALPTGGTTTLPCVVLGADATAVNPCQTAGGTYVSTLATLLNNQELDEVSATGAVLATVRVCSALLTAQVAGIGVRDVPAYTIC